MSFLDRFKTQPKYRNPDPAIRLAGVAELPDDAEHWGVIAELAASDEDVRVRRAAHRAHRRRRLPGADCADASATSRCGASSPTGWSRSPIAPAETDGDAATALDGLSDQKQFGTVAKSSPHETVRTAALGKIHDVEGARQRRAPRRRRADRARRGRRA